MSKTLFYEKCVTKQYFCNVYYITLLKNAKYNVCLCLVTLALLSNRCAELAPSATGSDWCEGTERNWYY